MTRLERVHYQHCKEQKAVYVLLENAAEPDEHYHEVLEQRLEEADHFQLTFNSKVWLQLFDYFILPLLNLLKFDANWLFVWLHC